MDSTQHFKVWWLSKVKKVRYAQWGVGSPHPLLQLLLRFLELALQLQQRAVLQLRRAIQVVIALRRLHIAS